MHKTHEYDYGHESSGSSDLSPEDYRKALAELRKLCKEQGKTFIQTHDIVCEQFNIRRQSV